MWYDGISNTVYWYGGAPYYDNIQPAVWGFTPNDQGSVTWTTKYTAGIGQPSTGSNTFSGFTEPAGTLWVSSPTTYYSLGGYVTAQNDPALSGLGNYRPALSGLVTFNFQEASWRNMSSAGYQVAGFGIFGQALYIPIFGKEGILLFLGGDAPTSQAWDQGTSLVPMSAITIYDIQSGVFYQQKAGGSNIPAPRTQFCAVGAGAADNSTWEMYVLFS